MKKSLSDNPCMPYPWWLIAGSNVTGDVLVAGQISDGDICLLKMITRSFSQTTFDIASREEIQEKFDAIILFAGATQTPDLTRKTANKLYGNLKDTGALVVYGCKVNINNQNYSSSSNISMPCLAYSIFPSEAFVTGKYTSNKNIGLFKEKIKKLIFKTPFFKLFIDNYLQVFVKSSHSITLLTELSEILSRVPLFAGKNEHVLSKIIFKYGKLIAIFEDIVVVVPTNHYALSQRLNEKKIIDALRNIDNISRYLVSYIIESEVCGFTVYIMENTHGNTVDINSRHIQTMINNAYGVIRDIAVTTVNGHYTEKRLEAKLGIYFQDFNARLNRFDISIGNNIGNLSKKLAGIPIVFMHGDLKLENFVLGPAHDVRRIIDWELADQEGLPLLDLYFFITYNNAILSFNGMLNLENTSECFRKTLDKSAFSIFRSMIDDYVKALGISDEQATLLFTVFVIHHFAYRLFIVDDSPQELERLRKIIDVFIKPTLEAIRK